MTPGACQARGSIAVRVAITSPIARASTSCRPPSGSGHRLPRVGAACDARVVRSVARAVIPGAGSIVITRSAVVAVERHDRYESEAAMEVAAIEVVPVEMAFEMMAVEGVPNHSPWVTAATVPPDAGRDGGPARRQHDRQHGDRYERQLPRPSTLIHGEILAFWFPTLGTSPDRRGFSRGLSGSCGNDRAVAPGDRVQASQSTRGTRAPERT